MAEVKVEKIGDEELRVKVHEEGGETAHQVTLDKGFADKSDLIHILR